MDKWISTDERLPEMVYADDLTSKKVLICMYGYTMDVGWYDHKHKGWYNSHGYFPNVSHWMPLPDAPGKEDEHET